MPVKRVFQTEDGQTFKTRAEALRYTMDVQINAELAEWFQQAGYSDVAGECYRLAEFLQEHRTIVVSYLTRKPINDEEDPNLDPETEETI